MKNILLAVALSLSTAFAAAHPMRTPHYHDGNGRVVIGNTIFPKVETRFEFIRGERVRVVETTRCTKVRVQRRNNHLFCLEESVSTERMIGNQHDRWDRNHRNDRDHRWDRDDRNYR